MGGVPVCLDNTPACLGGQVGLGWGRVNGRCTRLFGQHPSLSGWVDRLALGGGGLMGGVPVCLDNTPACLGGQVGLGWGRVNGRCTRLFG